MDWHDCTEEFDLQPAFSDLEMHTDSESDEDTSDTSSVCDVDFTDFGINDCMNDSDEEEEWLDVDIDSENGYGNLPNEGQNCNIPGLLNHEDNLLSQMSAWLIFFMAIWQSVYKISDSCKNKMWIAMSKWWSVLTAILKVSACPLPTSVYMERKYLGVERDDFEKYVTCPKCYNITRFSDFFQDSGEPFSQTCTSRLYSKGKYSKPCGEKLVNQIVYKNVRKYVPNHVYSYSSVVNSLEELLSRPGIEELCTKWKEREQNPDTYSDIYDGSVWQKFQSIDGNDFFDDPYSYGLMNNVDWFCPYVRIRTKSIGAIYAVLLNLPRHLRHLEENVILIGILPDLPKEPDNLNSFMQPFVEEMKALWKGVRVATYNHPDEGKDVRAALLVTASDIPATRKVTGLLHHNARLGCSKCLKSFPRREGTLQCDCSGFDTDQWPERTNQQHRQDAEKTLKCKTKTSRAKMESQLGARWSVLLDLDYMDVINFHVIDPLHNLFLGTSKRMFCLWVEKDLLTKADLVKIDEKLAKINVPCDIGRLPTNIGSNWGGFTGSQWKNWTLLYSLDVLNGILGHEHFLCWQLYAEACIRICQQTVTLQDAERAHELFIQFGNEVERLYGKEAVTPNMHLHCHLLTSIKQYGSLYGFSCYPFERYNGSLAEMPNNRHHLSVQFMRQFRSRIHMANIHHKLPKCGQEIFQPVLESLIPTGHSGHVELSMALNKIPNIQLPNDVNWHNLTGITLPPTRRAMKSGLDESEVDILDNVYKHMYPEGNVSHDAISQGVFKYSHVYIGKERYGSALEGKTSKHCFVMASWCDDDGDLISGPNATRAGLVRAYLQHSLYIDGKLCTHIFAMVSWYKGYEAGNTVFPLTAWQSKPSVRHGVADFVPVQRLERKFIPVPKGRQTPYMVAIPMQRKTCDFS